MAARRSISPSTCPTSGAGYYTSFIQTTATLGLFVSLIVILIVQRSMSPEDFQAWGWRVPFLASIFLVAISLYIRLRLQESPLFAAMKAAGRTSKAPIAESFGSWSKWQTILTVLWGAAAGQAVVWYCGQFYALFWLQNSNQEVAADGTITNLGNVPAADANVIIAVALLLATPVLHRLRRALRPHRSQARDDGRQPHRRSDDDPDLQPDVALSPQPAGTTSRSRWCSSSSCWCST